MAVQKSNQPAAMSDNDISGSGSDDSESGETCTRPNNHVAKEPEISQSEDEDSSSGSESDVLRPSKTIAKVPGKVSTLKRSRCDDGGGPSENARSSMGVIL